MKKTMNELKKNLEEYLESEHGDWRLLLMGKDEAELMLNLFKALDKAIELLNKNMLCENCPFPQNAECCTAEGCREYLRECLLKGE